jgi:phage shock protein PspC (stress-responsive transcriptional regulator)
VDDRLYKSTTDRSLSGVCGGLAAWLGLDPSLVRIVWVLLALLSGGVFVVLYIVMAVVVPDAPPGWAPRGRVHQSGPPSWGPGYGQGWGGSAPGGAWTDQTGWQGGARPAAGPPTGAAPDPTASGGTPSSWPEDWGRPRAGQSSPFPVDRASIVIGGVLVALGVWFLVKDRIPINPELVWPVAVIALGGLMIAGAVRRGR